MAKKLTEEDKGFSKSIASEMLKLATSGLGLVAALAWNELIKELVEQYIKPFAGESSGVISLLVYAIVVTILAVAVTYSLSKLKNKT